MPKKKADEGGSDLPAKSNFVRCRYCGQKNSVKADYTDRSANCGRCKLPLSNEPHKKFADLGKHEYVHPLDSKAPRCPESDSGDRLGIEKAVGSDPVNRLFG
jgi:hypothetical protein